MLAIHNLHIDYGDLAAVRDLRLTLGQGEIMALVGPTGCGKSSVLRAVAGLIQPDGGEIVIDGLCTSRKPFIPPEKRRTGLVFQDFALFPHLDVERNIGFRVKDPAEVDRWISALGLRDHRHAMPETLSGGQKQRVALARSLAHRPKLLLLDEPLSNLDAAMQVDLRAQIREAIRQAGVTALWVTHDQDEAMAVGDRIAVMREGRIEQVDTPEHCYERPVSRFVAEFFGAGLFLAGEAFGVRVRTVLGEHDRVMAGRVAEDAHPEQVRVLVRPHDIALDAAGADNATVQWQAYEGETRRYGVRLDSGERLEARLSHERRIEPGHRVRAYVDAGHPLVAFA